MELTQAIVNDLLDRLGPGDGHMYLPDDVDPQGLTGLLSDRYGAARTLVLDGFTDPTADASKGTDLLLPFGDRTVRMRAWAYGDQWIGTGAARDAEGTLAFSSMNWRPCATTRPPLRSDQAPSPGST